MNLRIWLLLIWCIIIVSAEICMSQRVEIFVPKIIATYMNKNKKELKRNFPDKKILSEDSYFLIKYTTSINLINQSIFTISGQLCSCFIPNCFDKNIVVIIKPCNYTKDIITQGHVEDGMVKFQDQGQTQYLEIKSRISRDVWSTNNDTLYISGWFNNTNTPKIGSRMNVYSEEAESDSFQDNSKKNKHKLLIKKSKLTFGIIGFLIFIAVVCVLIFGGTTFWNSLANRNDETKNKNKQDSKNNNCDSSMVIENNYYNSNSDEQFSVNHPKSVNEQVYSEISQYNDEHVENNEFYNQSITYGKNNISAERVYTVPYSHQQPGFEKPVNNSRSSEYAYAYS